MMVVMTVVMTVMMVMMLVMMVISTHLFFLCISVTFIHMDFLVSSGSLMLSRNMESRFYTLVLNLHRN